MVASSIYTTRTISAYIHNKTFAPTDRISHDHLKTFLFTKDIIVPIPRRPGWEEEELEEVEKESFLAWRKGLATLEEDYGFVVTPFERNLDFWRQLWRVVERADLVVQILDCRDPLFYRSRDLELWVKELGKNNLVLLNKVGGRSGLL